MLDAEACGGGEHPGARPSSPTWLGLVASFAATPSAGLCWDLWAHLQCGWTRGARRKLWLSRGREYVAGCVV